MKLLHLIEQAPDFMFWCPGCNMAHPVYCTRKNRDGEQWDWNGSVDKPTITPSIHWVGHCHLSVTDGMLHYSDDETCKHELRGKIVPMVEF